MLIFLGLPAKVRREPQKDAKPTTKPNIRTTNKPPKPWKPPEALRGSRSRSRPDPDQSQADKGGSGNLGRQPETRKGIKLGGCLRKQGVGKRNQHTSFWFVGHESCAVARYAAPPHPWVCRGAISTCDLQPPRGETP